MLIVILVLLALAFPIIAIIALVMAIDLRGLVRRLDQRVRMLEHAAPPGAAPARDRADRSSRRAGAATGRSRHGRRAAGPPPPPSPQCSATAAASHVGPDRAGAAFLTAAAADRL